MFARTDRIVDSAFKTGEELQDYFIYYERMEKGGVPDDVTHVKLHTSIRALQYEALKGREQLLIVILNDELEVIGTGARFSCRSLHEIVIPNKVKTIKDETFAGCTELTTVTLGEGLEEIRGIAFEYCTLLEEIIIPNTVKTIYDCAFQYCYELTTVTLGNGMEEIGERVHFTIANR